MQTKRILVIGDVFVDVDVKHFEELQNVHLGGIFHSARALCSLGVEYGMLYSSPKYLEKSIDTFSKRLDCRYCKKIVNVIGSPNVMLIGDKFEAGNQYYSEILRNQNELNLEADIKNLIAEFNPTDVILYPIMEFSEVIAKACNELNIDIHIDAQYDDDIVSIVSTCKIRTLITSSSSTLFLNDCCGQFNKLTEIIENKMVETLLFKENRGGSRFIDFVSGSSYEFPCFPIHIMHSVGVGDCFNSVFISLYDNEVIDYIGKLASYIASLYASTYVFDEFKDFVTTALAYEKDYYRSMSGQRIAWEDRREHLIYIAAPDFPYVDTRFIEHIDKNLKYHGFDIFRPIKENGLMTESIERSDELSMFSNDVKALEKASLMVAILLFDDPGTLVEIGYFFKSGKPIILFDPYRIAKNMFLLNSVNDVCYNLESVTEAVFKHLSRCR